MDGVRLNTHRAFTQEAPADGGLVRTSCCLRINDVAANQTYSVILVLGCVVN